MKFFETSPKTGYNINEVFETSTIEIINNLDKIRNKPKKNATKFSNFNPFIKLQKYYNK